MRLQELVAEMVTKEIPLGLALREFEAAYLVEVISRNGGNHSAAARQLGMHRNTLSRKAGQRLASLSYNNIARRGASSA
jgi:ActR/RegA family two-component response regulator